MEIPEALLAQLRHSDATGARCEIDLAGDEDPADVADLKRQLIRAGYRHFPGKTIHKRFTESKVTYWVSPKRAGSKTS